MQFQPLKLTPPCLLSRSTPTIPNPSGANLGANFDQAEWLLAIRRVGGVNPVSTHQSADAPAVTAVAARGLSRAPRRA
jgi:hypothetical protein